MSSVSVSLSHMSNKNDSWGFCTKVRGIKDISLLSGMLTEMHMLAALDIELVFFRLFQVTFKLTKNWVLSTDIISSGLAARSFPFILCVLAFFKTST